MGGDTGLSGQMRGLLHTIEARVSIQAGTCRRFGLTRIENINMCFHICFTTRTALFRCRDRIADGNIFLANPANAIRVTLPEGFCVRSLAIYVAVGISVGIQTPYVTDRAAKPLRTIAVWWIKILERYLKPAMLLQQPLSVASKT